MKAVINKKLYDTATAEMVAAWSNGYGAGDFYSCDEALFRTKKGAFFLHGKGGAATSYAKSCGDSKRCGESIVPMGASEAREWLETHDANPDVIARFFGVEEA
jgi:hypothetical protein